ncbi:MAG: transcription termination/antitermination protein NusA [Selenomonadaceae bacterium]|nr:transcription termination/antitermination protein NusA [Selenomonadaceae bacterium]
MAVKKSKPSNPNVQFLEAIKALCFEREISEEDLFDAIEAALVVAYKKNFDAAQNVEVNIDRETGTYHVYALKTVVEHIDDKVTQISALDAHVLDPRYEIGDIVRLEVTPKNFGRIAATAAKQFVVQRVREIERGILFQEFSGRENDLVSGSVVRIEHGDVIVNIGKSEAILLPAEQLPNEEYHVGDHIRAYIAEVKKGSRGPQIYISRTHPGLLKRLFELEVPEIQEGIIEIKSVARDAGTRSKVSVMSNDENVDPVGSCLGDKGIRVQAINNEIGNEKIDVIQWSADPVLLVSNALSPAKVLSVAINEKEKIAQVVVPDQQLSLAIGREGQNARLAAKLTGWKIDIKSKSQSLDIKLDDDFVVTKLKKQKPKKQKPKPAPKPIEPPKPKVEVAEVQQPSEQPSKKKKKKKQKPDIFTGQEFEKMEDTGQNFGEEPSGGFNFFDDDDDD